MRSIWGLPDARGLYGLRMLYMAIYVEMRRHITASDLLLITVRLSIGTGISSSCGMRQFRDIPMQKTSINRIVDGKNSLECKLNHFLVVISHSKEKTLLFLSC